MDSRFPQQDSGAEDPVGNQFGGPLFHIEVLPSSPEARLASAAVSQKVMSYFGDLELTDDELADIDADMLALDERQQDEVFMGLYNNVIPKVAAGIITENFSAIAAHDGDAETISHLDLESYIADIESAHPFAANVLRRVNARDPLYGALGPGDPSTISSADMAALVTLLDTYDIDDVLLVLSNPEREEALGNSALAGPVADVLARTDSMSVLQFLAVNWNDLKNENTIRLDDGEVALSEIQYWLTGLPKTTYTSFLDRIKADYLIVHFQEFSLAGDSDPATISSADMIALSE